MITLNKSICQQCQYKLYSDKIQQLEYTLNKHKIKSSILNKDDINGINYYIQKFNTYLTNFESLWSSGITHCPVYDDKTGYEHGGLGFDFTPFASLPSEPCSINNPPSQCPYILEHTIS